MPTDVSVAVAAAFGDALERLGDAEVGDDRGAAGEEDVVRLDVAMDDAALVRVGERARDVAQDAHRFATGSGRRARAARAATRPRRTASCSTAAPSTSPAVSTGTMCGCCSARGERDLALEALDAHGRRPAPDASTLMTTSRPSAVRRRRTRATCRRRPTRGRDRRPRPSSPWSCSKKGHRRRWGSGLRWCGSKVWLLIIFRIVC